MPDLEERITELEIQLMHLTRTCEHLNEVITQQAFTADRQARSIDRLIEQIKQLKQKPQPPEEPYEEKPPHY